MTSAYTAVSLSTANPSLGCSLVVDALAGDSALWTGLHSAPSEASSSRLIAYNCLQVQVSGAAMRRIKARWCKLRPPPA
jgi:hypothetical protein